MNEPLRMTRNFVTEALESPIPDIGQIDKEGKNALAQAIRAGELAKWRGRWFPTPGAPWGIGPLKTCYGRPEWKAYFESFKIQEPPQ